MLVDDYDSLVALTTQLNRCTSCKQYKRVSIRERRKVCYVGWPHFHRDIGQMSTAVFILLTAFIQREVQSTCLVTHSVLHQATLYQICGYCRAAHSAAVNTVKLKTFSETVFVNGF